MTSFDALLAEGLAEPFSGWDFSWLDARSVTTRLPWSYRALVSRHAATAASMLDMGTGGGEMLSRLAPRPGRAAATECWPPNTGIAARRLRPLGIPVVQAAGAPDNMAADRGGPYDGLLPFRDGAFGLVINRHEAFDAGEVCRVLAAGGTFITQQVDYRSYDDLHRLLGLEPPDEPDSWLPLARQQARDAGLEVQAAVAGEQVQYFGDVAAVVYYLRIVSWAIEGPGLTRLRPALRTAFETKSAWPVPVRQRRFLITAIKPG